MSLEDIKTQAIEHFSLTDAELREKMSSGTRGKFDDRMKRAPNDLAEAGFLQSPWKAHFQITSEGKEQLETSTDIPSLRSNVPDAVRQGGSDADAPDTAANDDVGSDSEDSTPDKQIAVLYRELSDRLADELLERVKRVSPADFERLVVSLLEKMGYGQGQVIGGSGDGGIDGIINQDALGLEKVYIQAKRWENPVGEPQIRVRLFTD